MDYQKPAAQMGEWGTVSKTEIEKEAEAKIEQERRRRRGRKMGDWGKWFILFLAIVIVAVAGAIFLPHWGEQKSAKRQTIFDTKAFFLPEDANNVQYALFNRAGEKLTDFKFARFDNFIDKYVTVYNKELKLGTLKEDGSMGIDFDKYKEIKPVGGLFFAKNEGMLVTASGKEVEKVDDETKISAVSREPFTLLNDKEKHYKLYNARGEEILNFESETKPVLSDGTGNFVALSYKGKVVLFDGNDMKKMSEFDSEKAYYVYNGDAQNVAVTLGTEEDEYNANKTPDYAVFYRGKLTKINYQDCGNLRLVSYSVDLRPRGATNVFVACKKKDGSMHVLKDDGSFTADNLQSSEQYIYDGNHYARFLQREGEVKIYVDGKEKLALTEVVNFVRQFNHYYVEFGNKKNAAIYSKTGELVFKSPEKDTTNMAGPDENGNVVVEAFRGAWLYKLNGTKLFNTSGGMGIEQGVGVFPFYTFRNKDKKRQNLVDKDGKERLGFDYAAFYKQPEGDLMVALKLAEGEEAKSEMYGNYVFLDKDFKENKSFLGFPRFDDANYIRVQVKDGSTEFYTWEGKKIHSYKALSEQKTTEEDQKAESAL